MVYFTFNMASVKSMQSKKCRPKLTLEQQLAETNDCIQILLEIIKDFVDTHSRYDERTELGQRSFECERQDLADQLEKLTAEKACLLKKIEMRKNQKEAFVDTDISKALPSDVIDLIRELTF